MFLITNKSKSSGKHTFMIGLRNRYRSSILSERKLRVVLLRSIEAIKDENVRNWYQDVYDQGDLLQIMRDFGMVTSTKMMN